MNPNLISKAAGSNEAFYYDWQAEMAPLGAAAITSAVWTVVAGNIALNADGRQSFFGNSRTTTYVSGGVPGEVSQVSCSVTFDTEDELVQTFAISIKPGVFQADPTTSGELDFPLGGPL